MAQKYSGSFEAQKFQEYLGSAIKSTSIMQMKSKNILISVNGSAMFPFDYNDETLLDNTYTYQFNKTCILALKDI